MERSYVLLWSAVGRAAVRGWSTAYRPLSLHSRDSVREQRKPQATRSVHGIAQLNGAHLDSQTREPVPDGTINL